MSASVTGYSKNESLADRMKRYESVTDFNLVPGVPVYVRLDQRAGHTFTKSLEKPFDGRYVDSIKSAAFHLVEETNPLVAYVQSDEISLVYERPEKMPFEGRIFKIQSVFASMASSAFTISGIKSGNAMCSAVLKAPPSFDCRVCQMPLPECANMILWRQRDCIKNSITLAALDVFSEREIEGMNSDDKVRMLSERGVDYSAKYTEGERLGRFVRKEKVERRLSEDELVRIPEDKRPLPDLFGDVCVKRNVVKEVFFGRPLDEIANVLEVLFDAKDPVYKPC